MDALLDIIGRGVSAPGEGPCTDKAKIVVTIDLDTLREHVATGRPPAWAWGGGGGDGSPGKPGSRHGGRGSGSCQSGEVLSAATVRRMACDAAIIPVVLGSQSQPLDVGRQERLVTRAIRTALWLRDAGCTFPGCSVPAQWTDAHHVRHWLHGGENVPRQPGVVVSTTPHLRPHQEPHRDHHRHRRDLAHLATLAHHLRDLPTTAPVAATTPATEPLTRMASGARCSRGTDVATRLHDQSTSPPVDWPRRPSAPVRPAR